MQLVRHLEEQARASLPEAVYDVFAGGAGDERTLAENVLAWQKLWLRPRHLVGVETVDPSVELLGTRLSLPVLLAPVAAHGLVHPEGEPATARAAGAAGTIFCLSTRSTADLGAVAEAAGGPFWFQLYVQRDREPTRRVLRRLREAGCTAVVFTVDLPVAGRRERELRHGPVALPPGVRLASHLDEPTDAFAHATGGWDASLAWQDLAWVREESGLPVLVKGVLTAEDALLAVEHGADGIVVSNHGGRQLDGAVPTAVALREVAEAVGDRVPVLVDGGIRDGADVVRALALGARAVLIGRPYVWALATGGEDGVAALLAALAEDVARTLALVGCPTPADVRPDHVRAAGW